MGPTKKSYENVFEIVNKALKEIIPTIWNKPKAVFETVEHTVNVYQEHLTYEEQITMKATLIYEYLSAVKEEEEMAGLAEIAEEESTPSYTLTYEYTDKSGLYTCGSVTRTGQPLETCNYLVLAYNEINLKGKLHLVTWSKVIVDNNTGEVVAHSDFVSNDSNQSYESYVAPEFQHILKIN